MEKYSRVLVIIFFLVVMNIGLTVFILNKINKPVDKPLVIASPTPSSSTLPVSPKVDETGIRSDLNLIKAEIRALRESLDVTGLITQTPEP